MQQCMNHWVQNGTWWANQCYGGCNGDEGKTIIDLLGKFSPNFDLRPGHMIWIRKGKGIEISQGKKQKPQKQGCLSLFTRCWRNCCSLQVLENPLQHRNFCDLHFCKMFVKVLILSCLNHSTEVFSSGDWGRWTFLIGLLAFCYFKLKQDLLDYPS